MVVFLLIHILLFNQLTTTTTKLNHCLKIKKDIIWEIEMRGNAHVAIHLRTLNQWARSCWLQISLAPDLVGPRSRWPKISLAPDLVSPRSRWPQISLAPDFVGPRSRWPQISKSESRRSKSRSPILYITSSFCNTPPPRATSLHGMGGGERGRERRADWERGQKK